MIDENMRHRYCAWCGRGFADVEYVMQSMPGCRVTKVGFHEKCKKIFLMMQKRWEKEISVDTMAAVEVICPNLPEDYEKKWMMGEGPVWMSKIHQDGTFQRWTGIISGMYAKIDVDAKEGYMYVNGSDWEKMLMLAIIEATYGFQEAFLDGRMLYSKGEGYLFEK